MNIVMDIEVQADGTTKATYRLDGEEISGERFWAIQVEAIVKQLEQEG